MRMDSASQNSELRSIFQMFAFIVNKDLESRPFLKHIESCKAELFLAKR